ncbi:MAG: hypothetical protein V4662_13585 [Verrucomicrobiota bacterium]
MTVRDAIPRAWLDFLEEGPVGIGMDIATTDGPHSNPASITVAQLTGGMIYERLVLSWKTRDEAIASAMLTTVVHDLVSIKALIKGGSIDASNETFFAQRLAKSLSQHCRFQLLKGNELVTFQGQTLPSKELLGNLYVNAHTDGILCTPEAAFAKEDRRLVQKQKGKFVTLTGKGGKHGDTFDSGKHARWALLSNGPASAFALQLGGGPTRDGSRMRRAEDEDNATTEAYLNA